MKTKIKLEDKRYWNGELYYIHAIFQRNDKRFGCRMKNIENGYEITFSDLYQMLKETEPINQSNNENKKSKTCINR